MISAIAWERLAVGIAGTLVLMLTSGLVIKLAIKRGHRDWWQSAVTDEMGDTGTVVGKCENVLVVVLVLLGEYTALTLLFTAKAIVRREDLTSENSLFYLAGTLVNVAYSVVFALALRWLLLHM